MRFENLSHCMFRRPRNKKLKHCFSSPLGI
nr:MAG TPA: hypothetical protein [Caudoviricetes sp.]